MKKFRTEIFFTFFSLKFKLKIFFCESGVSLVYSLWWESNPCPHKNLIQISVLLPNHSTQDSTLLRHYRHDPGLGTHHSDHSFTTSLLHLNYLFTTLYYSLLLFTLFSFLSQLRLLFTALYSFFTALYYSLLLFTTL